MFTSAKSTVNNRWTFGSSACRDLFCMVLRSKGPIFNWSQGPIQPRKFTPSNNRSHSGDPLALQGAIFY